jgi:hypothetical protein
MQKPNVVHACLPSRLLLIVLLSFLGFPVYSAQQEILFSDTFDNTNASATWQIINGTWEVKNGRFEQAATEGSWLNAITGKESWLDYEFEAKGRALKKGNIGIIFRSNVNRSKFYYFGFANAGKQLAIIQYEDGNWERVTEVSRELEVNRDYLFKVVVVENHLRAFLDGEEIFNYYKIGYRTGKIGLHSRAIPASFDDVKVSRVYDPDTQSGMDEYEVTYAEFKKFIDAGGYENQKYWSTSGWQEIQENSVKQPALWDQSHYHQLEDPVVGVTWYEADAYCRWAGKRLPTDKEWFSACEQGEIQKSMNILEWTTSKQLGMWVLRGLDLEVPRRTRKGFSLQCPSRASGVAWDNYWGFRCIRDHKE